MGGPGDVPVDHADVWFMSGVLTVTPPLRVYFRREALLSIPAETKQRVQSGGAVEGLLPAPVARVEVDAIIDEGEQGGSYQLTAPRLIVVIFG